MDWDRIHMVPVDDTGLIDCKRDVHRWVANVDKILA